MAAQFSQFSRIISADVESLFCASFGERIQTNSKHTQLTRTAAGLIKATLVSVEAGWS